MGGFNTTQQSHVRNTRVVNRHIVPRFIGDGTILNPVYPFGSHLNSVLSEFNAHGTFSLQSVTCILNAVNLDEANYTHLQKSSYHLRDILLRTLGPPQVLKLSAQSDVTTPIVPYIPILPRIQSIFQTPNLLCV